MQRLLFFSWLIVCLVAPTDAVWACGDSGSGKEKTGCCTTTDVPEMAHCSENSDVCSESHPGQACPDEDGCGGCHCPGCGNANGAYAGGFLPVISPVAIRLPDTDDNSRQAFYFADHMPEEVYLPIWQPPQISA
ncbi:MAG: hypothetical protein SFV22_18600 [Saprospiraceae bacterium]|nr:hypothetical protein [Saprospiraceae bacterium]